MKAPAASFRPRRPAWHSRTGARVLRRFGLREQVWTKILVERVDHVGDRQILGLGDGARESLPEIAQHRLPLELAAGDVVELGFELGGEVVFDVALEEPGQEGGDDAAAILRDEPLALQSYVVAVLQHRQDRGVGRRPADAELLEPLD